MQSTQAAVEALSRIPEARLLGEPSDATDAAYDALQGISFDGIAVRAQAVVAKDTGSRVPVLVCISQSAARTNEVPAGDNAVLVVNRIDGADAWSVPVYPRRPEKIPRRGASAPPPPPAGGEAPAQPLGSKAVQYLDLGAGQAMAGSYALRVISYDWRSNTVTIRMRDAQTSAAQQDQATREAQRLKWAQAGRGSANSLPHFVKSPRSPAFEGTGIAAAFPEPAASGAPLPVYGTVRLPSRSTRADGPLAVETGHVVLARRGSVEPIVLPLEVPLYAGSGAMEGYFAYDLSKVAVDPLPPAEYAAYFVLAEYTAGPYRITIR